MFVFLAYNTSAQSLSDLTNETSLWNALAIKNNVDPTNWTKTAFRDAAKVYAQSVGLVYDGSSEGNLAILKAEIPHVEEYTEYIETSRQYVDQMRGLYNPRKQLALNETDRYKNLQTENLH